MAGFIAVSNFLAIVMIWAGPETRGRQLSALDDIVPVSHK
jgi:hypothetical protein